MPAFGGVLDEGQRWHLINFVRALGSGETARKLGSSVALPELVAPDFTFAVGPTPPRALRDYRGRRIVLLVLYTLPASRDRLAALGQSYDGLVLRGVEIIAVPRDAAPDAIRQLGDAPRILFPIVTDGAREIAGAYDLFAPGPHAELLVDRQGYLRARWTSPPDPNQLLAGVDRLNAEPVTAPPADEHTH
jgi:copper resistance protein D